MALDDGAIGRLVPQCVQVMTRIVVSKLLTESV
jgi:hypothetical protein